MIDGESGHSTYVLTCDLGSKMKTLEQVGFKVPSPGDSFYKEFDAELARKIELMLPDVEVRVIDMDALAGEILSRAAQFSGTNVASYCSGICVGSEQTLQINRLVDDNGKAIGLGPRPGFETIGINSLDKALPLVLVDDGVFSGETLLAIVRQIQTVGIAVEALVVGLCFPGAKAKIRQGFQGEIVSILDIPNPLDWMPNHDFFIFSPNCGRVRGTNGSGHPVPIPVINNGATFSVPYLSPFIDSATFEGWTSLPASGAKDFSLFCVQQTLDFFRRLEKQNKKEIRVGDLLGTLPRVSIPIGLEQKIFPSLSSKVCDFVSDVCHELS